VKEDIPHFELIIGFLQLAFIIKPYPGLSDSYNSQRKFMEFCQGNDGLFQSERIESIEIHKVNSIVVLHAVLTQKFHNDNLERQVQEKPRNGAVPFLDIAAETFKFVQEDKDYKKLKAFIVFYITNNPEEQFTKQNEQSKEDFIKSIFKSLGTHDLSPRELGFILMELVNAFDTVDSSVSVDDDQINRTIMPYLYCYYIHNDSITNWGDIEKCKSSLAPSLSSSSVESFSSFDRRWSTPKTTQKPSSRMSDGGGAAGGGAVLSRFGLFNPGGGAALSPFGFFNSRGGASLTRHRRNFRKHKCNQYSNKKKRSYKNKNINTKKYRKLHSKIKCTIKRRKSLRKKRRN